MRFLSNGDFGFPFTSSFYALKEFFVWSYQTGSANLDGLIRMPARLVYLLVFALFGNLAFGYFYIFSTIIIAFWAFYYFSSKVLEVKSRAARLLSSLFFAVNPIFLGNISKTGLVLAAAMLPLCLVMAKGAGESGRLKYLILWALLLNVSLIHPFTFMVNIVVSGIYFFYVFSRERAFSVKDLIAKVALIFGIAALMNAYFLLPIVSMHTLSKGALSSTISSQPVDYAALVDTLNAGNVMTGLSLSKNILLDYRFYNDQYKSIYYFGIFAFYAILITAYVLVKKQLSRRHSMIALILMSALLVLVALATVDLLHLDTLIKLLIALPAGWAFRSPLKWQLYTPMVLFGLLAIVTGYLTNRKTKKLFLLSLAVCFALMNGFLFKEVYQKLLTPRSIVYFGALQNEKLDHDNILFVTNNDCFEFERAHSSAMNELNQIAISKDIQLKQISQEDVSSVNVDSYNFILSCKDSALAVVNSYDFSLQDSFVDGGLKLFRNKDRSPLVATTDDVFATTSVNLDKKYSFVKQALNQGFTVTDEAKATPVTGLQDVFENVDFKDLSKDGVQVTVQPNAASSRVLLLRRTKGTLYYQASDNKLVLTNVRADGFTSVGAGKTSQLIIPGTKAITVQYVDNNYKFRNLITNPSLESGLWQKKVGDCYNYDSQPKIAMRTNSTAKTDGKQSLELEATRHIACTGPQSIPVTGGAQYLLGFDYQSLNGDYAGYSVTFDGTSHASLSGRLDSKKGWETFTKGLVAPAGAKNLQLRFYAYPTSSGLQQSITRYDNLKLTAIPPIQNNYYLLAHPTTKMQPPKQTDYKVINPTKTNITVSQATAPFFLEMSESYNNLWRLELNDASNSGLQSWSPLAHPTAIKSENHIELNGYMNGWYVDPSQLCAKKSNACVRNTDGSYNLQLTAEFTPQRWVYAGSILTGITIIGCAASGVYVWNRKRKNAARNHTV